MFADKCSLSLIYWHNIITFDQYHKRFFLSQMLGPSLVHHLFAINPHVNLLIIKRNIALNLRTL
jgi:hypothetical protein